MARITQPRAGEPIRRVETKNGPRYRVVLDVAPPGAPRKQQTSTLRTLSEARDFVTETRARLRSGTFTPRNTETVQEVCDRWLASRRDVRPVTVDGYRSHLAPVFRYMGHQKVQSVTLSDVEGLVQWMIAEGGSRGQGLGPRSVKGALVAFAQVLDMAQREGVVTQNVARLVKRPRHRAAAGTDLAHWKPDQLVQFVAHADGDDLAAAWRLTASGLTRADVLGLRWSDLDLDAGVALISQGRVALDHGDHVDDPKSESRRRAVPFESMWSGTSDLLRTLRARQAADRLRAGAAYGSSGLVVVDSFGRPVRPEWYSDRFRILASEAGLPPLTLHAVRHSLAFWLHSIGVTPADAAALLGHTVDVHLSTYLPHSGASGISHAAQALGMAALAAEA